MADPRYNLTDLLYREGGVPNLVAAALGLAATGARELRNLPTHAVRLPLLGLSYAVEMRERARREYADLVRRGLTVVATLRGESDSTAPAATQEEAPEPRGVAQPPREAEPPRVASSDTPEHRAPRRTAAAVAAGAPGVATAVAERATENAHREFVAGDELANDELPLADFDHLTLGQLRARLRQLDVAQLVQLRDYEQAHANRLPVVTLLENRIAKVQHQEASADPAQTFADAAAGAAQVGATVRP